MRENKFRAWDAVEKRMHQFSLMDLEKPRTLGGAVPYKADDGKEYYFYIHRQPVMQYTGLKDKNGRDVYEGDILRIPENNVLAVMTYETEQAGFFAQIKSFDGTVLSARIDNPAQRGIEVIGNLYENPELLK